MAYRVTDIRVIDPDDFSVFGIEAGKDEVSLLTCTPYGVNTRRLVVTGERVDAAFYLQINEFRGSRSLQLQLVDLRSAHDPGAREAEQLELCRTLIRGGGVSAKEAAKLLPSREQFVRVWRALEREVDGTLTSPELPFLRRLSAEALGAESFPRTVMCLAVFAERGLVTVERHDKYITLRLTGGKRVDLDASPYLCALREGLDGTKGGSSA